MLNTKIYHALLLLAASLLLMFSTACEKQSVNVTPISAGEIIDSHLIQIHSVDAITQILNTYQLADSFDMKYAVKTISITYQSTDIQGNAIEVSGALLIPQNAESLPLLSIQHGTETKNDLVASVSPMNSVEGISGLLTASMGYVTCIPDYPGFGVSRKLHPYTHAASLTMAVIDFLRASRSYCEANNISLDAQLYLTGYSEGGYVTLATQKELEQNYADEFTVSASAPMAGPYDLKGTTDFLLKQTTYNYPAYIAYFLHAYNELYDWNRLDEIFNAPYSEAIPSMFDGSMTFGEINAQLPEEVSSLIKQDFITNYFNGNEGVVLSALEENSPLNWTPSAPIHFFHGDADDVSPYQNTLTAIDSLTAHGATDIRLTTIPGGTHETASLPSVVGAISWIDSLYNLEK